MNPQDTVESIVAELYRRIRHGRLGRLQRKLNVGKNFFSRWKKYPERIRLVTLAEALEYLEIKPGDFFTSAFTQGSSLAPEPASVESCTSARLKSLLKSLEPISEPGTFLATTFPTSTSLPSGSPPAGVIKALARMAAPSSDLGEGSPAENLPGEMIDRRELARLDVFRWDDPRKANLLLERAIEGPPMELLLEILLVYGATFRQLDQLDDARWAYLAVEMYTKKTGNRSTLAVSLQKRSWVESADGGFSDALELLRRAAGIFVELGDCNRVGKVLVTMAVQYANREMLAECVCCATTALQMLNKGENWYHFSAYQALAYATKGLGKSKEALAHLKAAGALLVYCPKGVAIRFIWMEARMKKDLLSLEAAACVFEEAAFFFSKSGEVLDHSLAILECALCLLELGHTQELDRIIRVAKEFAFTVGEHGPEGRVAAAAMMTLYRASLDDSVTETLLASACQMIKKAAGRTPAADAD